jgi:hypothetical protein
MGQQETSHPLQALRQSLYSLFDVGDDMMFGIEAGAPRDGGAMVAFTACPLTADYPEQREGQPPTSKIKIDNVNRELVPKIRAALGVREYIQILYSEYLRAI